uniref:Uncharacterized protein n=1 Tax=Anguilla anguilla TaxID=7936 RepID=A0A0E9T9L3_ANGAN
MICTNVLTKISAA